MQLDQQTLTKVIEDLSTQDKVRVPVDGVSFAGIDVTHIEFNLTYSKDSYRNRPRGFYLSVQPVEVESQFVRMIPMQGVRGFVSPAPVARLSKAARKAAHANVGVETLTAYLEQVG